MTNQSELAPRPGQGCGDGHPCVLFVEDHVETRRVLSRLLRLEGYGVLSCATAQEARRLLATEPVDIIIADVELHDGNGCELLAHAKECAGGRPVGAIALSGHDDEGRRNACLKAGFVAYLLKPVQWQQLRDLLADVRP